MTAYLAKESLSELQQIASRLVIMVQIMNEISMRPSHSATSLNQSVLFHLVNSSASNHYQDRVVKFISKRGVGSIWGDRH